MLISACGVHYEKPVLDVEIWSGGEKVMIDKPFHAEVHTITWLKS